MKFIDELKRYDNLYQSVEHHFENMDSFFDIFDMDIWLIFSTICSLIVENHFHNFLAGEIYDEKNT